MLRISIDHGRTWAPIQEIYIEADLGNDEQLLFKFDGVGQSIDKTWDGEVVAEDHFTYQEVEASLHGY